MTEQKKNYKSTLNLPQTSFPMEAKLVTSEPPRLQRWKEMRLYEKVLAARAKSPHWILHDGPPFANGDIHMGHVINKTLKDVLLRYKTMAGFQTPYVPGWDCHGLPIEHKIQQELGPKLREMSIVDIRRRCHEYAAKYVEIQSEQFQRMGILGEWENPYLTMKPEYEAETLHVFAKFVEAGLVYKQLKPVPWSVANQTALADAELEYQDVEDLSVFVEFPIEDVAKVKELFGDVPNPSLLVWTTTPWTLPANLAVAVNPGVNYVAVTFERTPSSGRKTLIVAEDLQQKVFNGLQSAGPGSFSLSSTHGRLGRDMVEVGLVYKHPFIDRTNKVVLADYVTTTDGTGLVHTAPGHGEEDYETGVREGLEIYSPVLANGRFDDTVPEFLRGKTTKEGNALITEELVRRDLLFAEQKIRHSYPHDWRSKTPIIFRATEQWFIAMDKPFRASGDTDDFAPKSLRQRACHFVRSTTTEWREAIGRDGAMLDAADGLEQTQESLEWYGSVDKIPRRPEDAIRFTPAWGTNRMRGMLKSRPDWCISRQRAWGLPIPVFYNSKGEALLTPESVNAVAKRIRNNGCNAWYLEEPAQLLGADFVYPGGFEPGDLRKERDIFDVWFESGSSWHAVLQARSYLHFPADLYLEGSDQHRGWFQLSLLPSLGVTGRPPFKQVLTHGFIVKPDGTKVSKSDKEYVTATKEIQTHGADLLRLWCCSVDYQGDIPASPKALKDFGDKYRKIRNTLRYLLSNLYDFDPHQHAQPIPAGTLDGWVSNELDQLIGDVTAAYDRYELHRAFRLLHDFCSVQLSSVYGNAMKDRLYCDEPSSAARRRCQTVMHRLALALTKLLAPMLVFTADEAWDHILHKPADEANCASVHLALLPKVSGVEPSADQRAAWELLMKLRESALSQLDGLKKSVELNKALEAEVVFHVDGASRGTLECFGIDLEDMAGVGHHSFVDAKPGEAAAVEVIDRRQTYGACARCWKRRPDVGSDAEYPDLCSRDAAAVRAAG